MAMLTAPEKGQSNTTWVAPPEDMYECFVYDLKEIPNKYFDPDKDAPHKKTRLEWYIAIREDELPPAVDGETMSNRMRFYTSAALGWHEKNKLVGWLRDVYPDFVFDPDANDGKGEMTSFESVEDMREKVVGCGMRIMTTNKEVIDKESGETRTYVNVKAHAKTRRTDKVSWDELLRVQGATVAVTDGSDLPY